MGCTVAKLYLLLVLAIISAQTEHVNKKKHESRLLDTIFKNYDKRIRPVKDYHTPVVVNISLSINQIIQVDEKRQVITSNLLRTFRWDDDSLKWNPESYGDIYVIYPHRSEIWTPDIILYNSAAFGAESGTDYKSVVFFNGSVVDAVSMVVKTTCKIDVTWFPFDEQNCFLNFGSWTSPSSHLTLKIFKSSVDSDGDIFIDNGEWELLRVSSTAKNLFYPCCPDDAFITITYTIHLKRRAFYYFFNLLVPCFLIGFLAILGFTLPPESGEKLSLGATTLFSLIVFLNMISESMPANSDAVPLLGTYFNCVMFTIALSVVSTMVVNLKLKAGNPKEVQGLWKKIFICWVPRILCMNAFPNAVGQQQEDNEKKAANTIELSSIPSERIESIAFHSLHSNQIVEKQWRFIANVVDRLCLIISIFVTFLSVTIFLVYAF